MELPAFQNRELDSVQFNRECFNVGNWKYFHEKDWFFTDKAKLTKYNNTAWQSIGWMGLHLTQKYFYRSQIFFVTIALFAARDNVAPGAFSTAWNWDHMVHGQCWRGKFFSTVVTNALCNFVFPPLWLPHLAGFFFFPPHMLRVFLHVNPVGHAVDVFPFCVQINCVRYMYAHVSIEFRSCL